MQSVDPDYANWVLSSLHSGVVAVDRSGAVVVLNEGAQRVLGCPPGPREGAIGRPCVEVLGGQPAVARVLLDALHGGELVSRAELVLETAGDSPSGTIGFTVSPVRDAAGGVAGSVIFFRDLTPYERRNEQERLRERLAALGQMAADMAHEIRNPLAGIEVLAGLLRRRLGDRPEEQVLVGEILGELRGIADTVTASLDFVKPLAPSRAPVDPVEMLEESLALARARIPFDGAIEREYDEEVPAIGADAEPLRGAVTNLIVNALEAMGDPELAGPHRLVLGLRAEPGSASDVAVRFGGDGRPGYSAANSEREVVIYVSDTGPGVSAELREKIFYPFFTTKQHGSGVGLANAQKVFASLGGIIAIDGAPGRGATFRIRLPAWEAAA